MEATGPTSERDSRTWVKTGGHYYDVQRKPKYSFTNVRRYLLETGKHPLDGKPYHKLEKGKRGGM